MIVNLSLCKILLMTEHVLFDFAEDSLFALKILSTRVTYGVRHAITQLPVLLSVSDGSLGKFAL